jgi:hypothetical protein
VARELPRERLPRSHRPHHARPLSHEARAIEDGPSERVCRKAALALGIGTVSVTAAGAATGAAAQGAAGASGVAAASSIGAAAVARW